MGTDIHSVLQVRENGKWVTKMIHPGDDDRNYHTFSILANIRNGYGVAGISTGDTWAYIDEPRGFPDDFIVSNSNEHHFMPSTLTHDFDKNCVWMGDHSYSYVSLFEIMQYMERHIRNKTHTLSGVVAIDQYRQFKSDGELPTNYSLGISGPSVVIVNDGDDLTSATHVRMSWERPAESLIRVLVEYIIHMEKFVNEHTNLHDVRLVFGFDS